MPTLPASLPFSVNRATEKQVALRHIQDSERIGEIDRANLPPKPQAEVASVRPR